MTAQRRNKVYTSQFKEEAVSLVTEQGYSVSDAALSLGLTTKILYKWKKKKDEQNSGLLLLNNEREELIALRKQNKRLLMEREILKKASAFFAREMK